MEKQERAWWLDDECNEYMDPEEYLQYLKDVKAATKFVLDVFKDKPKHFLASVMHFVKLELNRERE